jgi:hypothetical protein
VHLQWLENLTKPFANIFNPISERVGNRIARRKPHISIHPDPLLTNWTIANHGGTELMQLMIFGGFTHDDRDTTLIITDAYVAGTQSKVKTIDWLTLPPGKLLDSRIVTIVGPVVAEKGKPFETRVILVDQFRRKYKSQKLTLHWAGPPPQNGG